MGHHPNALSRSRILILCVIVFLLGTASTLRAATVTAMWDPNTESDLAGYKLSYGLQSGVYTTTIDVGNVTSWPLTLTDGLRYYFAVQAYNTSGAISPFSAEVFADIGPPTIASLSPTSGAVGTPVTITGTIFDPIQGTSTVTFNGTVATPTSWSATSIVVPVPAAATTGNGVAFTVTPKITTLVPTSGAAGTPVTITGTTFGATQGTSTVTFNGSAATPTSWSASSIVVPVPAAATTGNVVVTVGGNASNGVAFTVLTTPGITSLAPTSGPVGTSVTITGANFGATQGTSTVTFNGTVAAPTR